ncbi:MAG: helix-turn-helix domain-containing protein [Dehalococcoidales bacterium]|jgi:excisionase family DNA binding protein|nr:helix-turn-helix domain-containing protein [Dehalococcoidales bacterium]
MITDTSSNERARDEAEIREKELPAPLLSVGEVARFLGVHTSTVRRWERSGLLKSYVIGMRHNLRFKQEDVLHFLDQSRGNR